MENQFPFEKFLNITGFNSEKKVNPKISSSSSNIVNSNLNELSEVSSEILKKLQENISLSKFNAYFKDTLHLESIENQNLIFCVSTNFIKTMIESYYLDHINLAAKDVLGKEFNIQINVKQFNPTNSPNFENNFLHNARLQKNENIETLAQNIPQLDEKKNFTSARDVKFKLDLTPSKDDMLKQVESTYLNHIEQDYGNIIDSKKTFETFVVGPSNNMAYASALACSKNPGKVYPCIYFYSNSGLGKTHLLHSVGNYIKKNNPNLRICLTTARDLVNEIVDAVKDEKMADFQKKYCDLIDVLMIDDIHELKGKKGTQNWFFHIFNELHNKGKQLIFTSDKLPREIDGVEERIKTRLSWGLVLDIQQPELETRIAILKRKAMESDIYLPEDVVNLIARAIKDNIRELEGSLIRLGAYSSVFKVDIDLEIAKEQLRLKDFDSEKKVTLEDVLKATSQYFKIPPADILSKVRLKNVTNARHIAMYLSHKIMQSTLVEIGQYYGKRDHTTVLHAITKIKLQLKNNPTLTHSIIEIENSI